MEMAKLSERRSCEGKHESAGDHLRCCAHDFGRRQGEPARDDGGEGPTHRGENEGDGAFGGDGRTAEMEGAAHQDSNTGEADQQRQSEAQGEFLRAQDEDFGQGHEDGNGGHHDGSDARGNTLLGPEEQAVVEDEDEKAEEAGGFPLWARGGRCAARDHPAVEDETGGEESHGGEEQWRDFADADADGEEGRSPQEVDDGEGQQNFPRSGMSVGLHGGFYALYQVLSM